MADTNRGFEVVLTKTSSGLGIRVAEHKDSGACASFFPQFFTLILILFSSPFHIHRFHPNHGNVTRLTATRKEENRRR